VLNILLTLGLLMNISKLDKIHNKKRVVPITLVNKALEEIGGKPILGTDKQYKQRLESICKSLLKTNNKATLIITSMLEKGIPIKDIYEKYIPDAARLLGRHWVNNIFTFAQVTLATSRLQIIAKELESLYVGENQSKSLGADVLIIAPKGEQHTFGAQMVSRKLKRLGTSPYLSINNTKEEIVNIVRKQKFKLIGLSIAGQNASEKNLELVNLLKAIRKLKIPIVAGGNFANSSTRILKSFNIDLVTNDVAHALNYFNINFSTQGHNPETLTV
tara:strand:- start:390 stop:1211 length:822 start_codon:yes stop_codon:yes gene_type:complete